MRYFYHDQFIQCFATLAVEYDDSIVLEFLFKDAPSMFHVVLKANMETYITPDEKDQEIDDGTIEIWMKRTEHKLFRYHVVVKCRCTGALGVYYDENFIVTSTVPLVLQSSVFGLWQAFYADMFEPHHMISFKEM